VLPRVAPGVWSAHASPARDEDPARRLPFWLAVPLFAIAVLVLAILRVEHLYSSPELFRALNLVFLTGVSLTISVVAARSFLAQESWAVLFIGMGTLALGLGAAAAALEAGGRGANALASAYNSSALLAGVCHLTGVVLGHWRGEERRHGGRARALAWYLLVGLLVLALVVLIRNRLWPEHFVQGSGPTTFGLAVLWTTIALFAISATVFTLDSFRSRSAFHYWYGLGLGLIVVGLIAVSLQKNLGDPLNWTGRAAQYLGGVYILFAVLPSLKRGAEPILPLEKALRESESRYQALFDLSLDAILVVSGGRIVFANPSAAAFFGAVTPSELVGRVGSDLVHPNTREAADRWSGESSTGESTIVRTTVLLRLDGSTVDADIIAAKVEFSGEPAILAIVHDVSVNERAEEAREASEERYRVLYDNMLDGYAHCRMIFDEEDRPVDFVYLDVNQSFDALTGLKDVVGKRVTELLPGILETHREVFEIYGRVSRSGVSEKFEVAVDRIGRVLAISAYSPAPDSFVAIFEDITARKRVEEALLNSEEQFRMMVDSSLDMFWVTDPDGYLHVVNRAYGEFFGIAPEDVAAHRWLPLAHEDDSVGEGEGAGCGGAFLEALRDRRHYRAEGQVRRCDGESRVLDSHAGPRRSAGGEFLGYVGVSSDVSDRVRAEKALREREDQLRQGQKMEAVGQLAGGIAHDFNNMLTAIIGYSELLLAEDGLSDSNRGDLEEIKNAAERASALTAQILAFSRRQALRPTVVSLGDILNGMELLLRHTLGENVELATRIDPDLGNVEADVHQFEQVIMNLALNARDAMPAGGRLTIEVSNTELGAAYVCDHPDVSPGSYVTLKVSDAGVGMDDATLARIFEPFFTTKPVGHGTGMGLATVYGIVKQSGGDISVQSAPSRGTIFTIHLPRTAEPGGAKDKVGRLPASNRGSGAIMVVEDEISLRRLTERVLRQAGYDTLSLGSAEEALKMLEHGTQAVDLLLTDVMLPGSLQGNELASAAASARPKLPVLFMSGYSRDALTSAGRLGEGVNLLEKPFTPDSLVRAVREVLDRSRV
jgi:two-component system, cell cycle sensor histidine kinase and response regulator CckA